MKILFLTRRFYPEIGGVEKHVLEISRELISEGNEILVVAEDSPKIYSNKKRNYQSIAKSAMEGVKFKEGVKSSYFDHYKANSLKILRLDFGKDDWFKKFRIWESLITHINFFYNADVIHCHDVFFWYLPLRILLPSKKVFVTFHGYETNFPPRLGAKIVRKISEVLTVGNISVGKYIERWYRTTADAITYGGVSLSNKYKVVAKKDKKKLRILFVGRLEEDNGAKIYLQALGMLKKRKIKFEFLVCGDGSLRNKAEKYGKVLGFTEDVSKYINRSDLIFASSYLSIFDALVQKKHVFSVYQNPLKKDYLELSPFKKYIHLSSNAAVLAEQIVHPVNKKKQGYEWARQQTWKKVAKLYLKLWQKN